MFLGPPLEKAALAAETAIIGDMARPQMITTTDLLWLVSERSIRNLDEFPYCPLPRPVAVAYLTIAQKHCFNHPDLPAELQERDVEQWRRILRGVQFELAELSQNTMSRWEGQNEIASNPLRLKLALWALDHSDFLADEQLSGPLAKELLASAREVASGGEWTARARVRFDQPAEVIEHPVQRNIQRASLLVEITDADLGLASFGREERVPLVVMQLAALATELEDSASFLDDIVGRAASSFSLPDQLEQALGFVVDLNEQARSMLTLEQAAPELSSIDDAGNSPSGPTEEPGLSLF